jgi:hypothetical protein
MAIRKGQTWVKKAPDHYEVLEVRDGEVTFIIEGDEIRTMDVRRWNETMKLHTDVDDEADDDDGEETIPNLGDGE